MAEVRVREIALEIVMAVLEKGEMGHLIMRQALEKYGYLEKQERSFLTRLSNGTISRVIELDDLINHFSKVRTEKMKPVVRNILRLTAYQLKYMDSVPDSAACNEAVKLGQRKGFHNLKGFINGVSRSMARGIPELPESDALSVRYALPEWLVEMWCDMYGEEMVRQSGDGFWAQETDGATTVRCNQSLAKIEDICVSLQKQGVKVQQDANVPQALYLRQYDRLEHLEAFQKGWIQVQDISSMLVGEAAAPEGEMICLDVCAAPGGKSMDLADRLAGQGKVYSCDISFEKTALIEENCMRCGFTNMEVQVQDALELREDWIGMADIVIADLPCSGLGIIGGKPDIKYKASLEKCTELAVLQRQMLSVIWQYVKPGGILIYSTCTINRQENEDNADFIASQLPFDRVSLQDTKGVPSVAVTPEGYVQLLPGRDGMAGFFLSKFTRQTE